VCSIVRGDAHQSSCDCCVVTPVTYSLLVTLRVSVLAASFSPVPPSVKAFCLRREQSTWSMVTDVMYVFPSHRCQLRTRTPSKMVRVHDDIVNERAAMMRKSAHLGDFDRLRINFSQILPHLCGMT